MESLQHILTTIRQMQNHFPAAQRQVAVYVVKNYELIPFLSITALARNIGVSEKTVIKFCNSLGFEKFTDFKKTFAEYAQSKLVITNKLTRTEPKEDQSNNIFDMTMNQDISAIRATMTLQENRDQFDGLIDMLIHAKHIYVTGGRASGIISGMLANMLRYLSLKVYEINVGIGDYYDRLMMVDPEDVVVGICFSRYTAEVVDGLEYLYNKSIPIALITDMELSPAYSYAKLVFHCEATAQGYFPSYSGCLSLIYAICSVLGNRRSDEAAEHTSMLEQILLDKHVFK